MSHDSRRPADIIDINSRRAQLIVRDLDPRVVRALKVRAAQKGISAEAEHRAILRKALLPRPSRSLEDALLDLLDACDEADFAVERDFERGDGPAP